MSDDDVLLDNPIFVRQRRNVMVTCLVVIAIVTLNLKYGDIRILDVKAGSPGNFDLAWASLILYFIWRLFQCEAPKELFQAPKSYLVRGLQLAFEKRLNVEHYKQKALDEYRTVLKEKGPGAIGVVTGQGTGKLKPEELDNPQIIYRNVTQPTVYNMSFQFLIEFQFKLNSSTSTFRQLAVTVSPVTPYVILEVVKAFGRASWRDQYFSEYYLPFWLGFSCIFYCITHHLTS